MILLIVDITYRCFEKKRSQIKQQLDTFARTYLQPHYSNGVFDNVYLLAEQH